MPFTGSLVLVDVGLVFQLFLDGLTVHTTGQT